MEYIEVAVESNNMIITTGMLRPSALKPKYKPAIGAHLYSSIIGVCTPM